MVKTSLGVGRNDRTISEISKKWSLGAVDINLRVHRIGQAFSCKGLLQCDQGMVKVFSGIQWDLIQMSSGASWSGQTLAGSE